MKVLQKDNWARMYLTSTPKLFDFSSKMMKKIQNELPKLYSHLAKFEVYLEILLASPLMTLFSNILSYTEATHILNQFILNGENYMISLIFNVYKNKSEKIITIKDSFEIQAYMSKEIYEEAINEEIFYP